MFTGIIEGLGILQRIEKEGTNVHFTFSCDFTKDLKVDQSLAHNGVCLTVIDINDEEYTVTAIKETLDKSNLGSLETHQVVNLERCTKIGARLDGHIVQGHVDTTATCQSIEELDGSWKFTFEYSYDQSLITVEKGSITINGVSLTVVDSTDHGFSVCIIPYTYENTSFRNIAVGTQANIEFDIVGKYVAKLHAMKG
ncbi:MAG: riboflavin synthase [Flavobacteriales bacterium]|nr:riboflavin synthase [Flavobacteriales bacterium]